MTSFRPSRLRLAGLVLGAALVAFSGCSSSATDTVSVTHPTMIRVEPEDFMGDVPCNLDGPGFKRYVARIVDQNYGEGGAGVSNALGAGGDAIPQGGAIGFEAPASLPTPCNTGVGFGFVVPGRHYDVFIDAYDTDAIEPRAKGSPEMVPAGLEGEAAVQTSVVLPSWVTRCPGAIASDSVIVSAKHCLPLHAPAMMASDPAATSP